MSHNCSPLSHSQQLASLPSHSTGHWAVCFLPLISPDQDFWFPIRRRRSYCGGLTCQVPVARLAVKSDHDWSAAGWEDSRLGSAAESHWRLRDCSLGRFKVDRENYFQGRKMKLPWYQYISFSIYVHILAISYYFNIKLRWGRCNLQENSKHPY